MLRKIQQVLRSVLVLGKIRQKRGCKADGGLLILMWTDPEAVQSLNCTVAAAGPWCTGIKIEALQLTLTDLKDCSLHVPRVWPCPQPDPEELFAFTDLYGSLRLLLSFQLKDATHLSPEWCTRIETFLHTFTLANAGIKIHLKVKINQQTVQRVFRGKIKSKVALANQPSLNLDVTCSIQPPACLKKGYWCQGGHPVLGTRLPVSIPPEVMDQGLFGELSILPVMFLQPCVLQYPNMATRLTHIQVLVCDPSNVPIIGPSTFLQKLPAHLDCQELGLHHIGWSSSEDLVHSGGTVYTEEQENCEDQEQNLSLPSVQQRLALFLLLQYSDPFTLQLCDIIATHALIEHHLEDILNHNRQAVTTALQSELKNAMRAQNRRKKVQKKLCSAAEVILSSSISIVSCSSNMDFRNACLNSMKVCDTSELSAALRESLRRVTSWKLISRPTCYTSQVDEHPESEEPTGTEL